MEDKVAILVKKILSYYDFNEDLEEAGVSMDFLVRMITANMSEIIQFWIDEAAETGEYHCTQCKNYFNFHQMYCFNKSDPHKGICKDCLRR
jgi:hypothetical protein